MLKEYLFPTLLTTFDETIDATNKEIKGSILFLRKILRIASIESPAPTLSMGLALNAGQWYLFNFESNNKIIKVGYVVPNSPAEKSGIIVNDIIIKVGDKDIEKASDVISQISKNGINKQINILLKRGKKFIRIKVIPTDITNLQNN